MWRPPLAVLAAACFLAGCSLPSQSNPSCSWATTPPSNADALCTTTFHTVAALATAVTHDNEARIHAIATTPAVAGRIIAYARNLKSEGQPSVHIVPSLTLNLTDSGEVGAAITVVGHTGQGRVKDQQTIYLRVHGNSAVVVDDNPDQGW